MDNFCNQIQKNHLAVFLLIALLMSLLAGCKSTKRHDGPPGYYVDETRIPNAVPKPERLAKYGNMPMYRVFGKKYYTLRSSKHYEEIGTASWYGSMFHARKTSSGEPYNMLSMTAAHKTLPLPTYVEVTNLSNHRRIIVKVNDRGPFESNRIIDLSYVAAKKLGMLGHGTATVRIKAIDPYTYGRPIYFAHRGERTWQKFHPQLEDHPGFLNRHNPLLFVQVGAFRNRSNAEQLKNRLIAMFRLPIQITYPTSGGQLYHVKVGPLRDLASAKIIKNRLKGIGIPSNRVLEA